MSRVVNFFKVIRNNWKKSLFGAAALSYGVSYGVESYNINELMREYCEHASKFGDEALPINVKPRHVTVILNPAARKSKSKKLFEAYCEPLLHLAGIAVTIIQTQSEQEARTLITNLNTPTDAIVVAGGDGTVSDVVTGLMRKYNRDSYSIKNCPVGVLPLGKTNTIANSLYRVDKNLADVKQMATATMSIVKGDTKLVDVIEIEPLEQDSENPIKPVYAVGTLQWGAWREAYAREDKYWYWAFLRRYATYLFNGYKGDLTWNCNATLRYTDPCDGCSRCHQQEIYPSLNNSSNRRWWHSFMPRRRTPDINGGDNTDYSKIINEECGVFREIPVTTTELQISTSNVPGDEERAKSLLKVQLGPKSVNYSGFVREGWKRANGNKPSIEQTLQAKDVELQPEKTNESEDRNRMLYIDNEEFELRPMRIKLLPRSLKVFCSEPQAT